MIKNMCLPELSPLPFELTSDPMSGTESLDVEPGVVEISSPDGSNEFVVCVSSSTIMGKVGAVDDVKGDEIEF